MKDKILLFLPYLFLILFFFGIMVWNINKQIEIHTLYEYENIVNESQNIVNKTEEDSNIDSSDDIICYHTKNGTKYHSTPNCQYLKNSKTIIKITYKRIGRAHV